MRNASRQFVVVIILTLLAIIFLTLFGCTTAQISRTTGEIASQEVRRVFETQRAAAEAEQRYTEDVRRAEERYRQRVRSSEEARQRSILAADKRLERAEVELGGQPSGSGKTRLELARVDHRKTIDEANSRAEENNKRARDDYNNEIDSASRRAGRAVGDVDRRTREAQSREIEAAIRRGVIESSRRW